MNYIVALWYGILFISGKDNGYAIGQGAAKGFIRFPSHDQVVSRGCFFEMPQISRQMPRQIVVFANDIVFPLGNNNGYFQNNGDLIKFKMPWII